GGQGGGAAARSLDPCGAAWWLAHEGGEVSGANASPTGRSHQEITGANANPTRSASAIARSLKKGRSHQEITGANASERWFRILLRLYPADFRDEMGEDLIATYRDRTDEALKRAGVLALAAVWGAALRDSLRSGLAERLRPAVAWRRGGDWGRDM